MREPFAIIAITDEYKEMAISQGVPAEYIQHITGMSVSLDGAEPPWTFSIVGDGTVYHKLNPRFLPDGGVGWTEEDVEVTLYEATYATSEELEAALEDGMLIGQNPIGLETGKTYVVSYCGMDYECEAAAYSPQEGINIIAIGNLAMMGGSGGEDIPFFMCDSPDGSLGIGFMYFVGDEPTFPFVTTVAGDGAIIHKIDKKYLPTNIGGASSPLSLSCEDLSDNATVTVNFSVNDIKDLSVNELQQRLELYVNNCKYSTFGLNKIDYNGYMILEFFIFEYNDLEIKVIWKIDLMYSPGGQLDCRIQDHYRVLPAQTGSPNSLYGADESGQMRLLDGKTVNEEILKIKGLSTLPEGTVYEGTLNNSSSQTVSLHQQIHDFNSYLIVIDEFVYTCRPYKIDDSNLLYLGGANESPTSDLPFLFTTEEGSYSLNIINVKADLSLRPERKIGIYYSNNFEKIPLINLPVAPVIYINSIENGYTTLDKNEIELTPYKDANCYSPLTSTEVATLLSRGARIVDTGDMNTSYTVLSYNALLVKYTINLHNFLSKRTTNGEGAQLIFKVY